MKKYIEQRYTNCHYLSHSVIGDNIILNIELSNTMAPCPTCGVLSKSIHVYTERSFTDLPYDNKMVEVHLFSKVFKCKNHSCSVKTFSEKLPFLYPDEKVSIALIDKVLEVKNGNSVRGTVGKLLEEGIIVNKDFVQRTIKKYSNRIDETAKILILDKIKTIEGIKNGIIDLYQVIVKMLCDQILESIEVRYNFINDIQASFRKNSEHTDAIESKVILVASVSARLKQLAATSNIPLALTSVELINKLGLNIYEKNGDGTYFTKGKVREYINAYEDHQNIIEDVNKYFDLIIDKLENKPTLHILDCTKLPVNYDNTNYECSTTIEYEGKKLRGYKVGVLRGSLGVSGIIEEVCFGTLKTHDLELVKNNLLKSKHLKPKDTLLMDRGFIDIESIVSLSKERKVNVIIPARNNMEIFTNAISIAKTTNIWEVNPIRKEQDIALVKDLGEYWTKGELKTDFSACVVRIPKKYNFDTIDEEYLSQDDKYMYIVILSTNTKLTASQIVKSYSNRPNIEEDFRQLKDYWGLCNFKSTKQKFITFYLATMFIAYNQYQLYKNLEVGKEFTRLTLPVAAKKSAKSKIEVSESKVIMVSGKSFGIFEQYETFELYDQLTPDNKKKFIERVKNNAT